MRDEEPYGAEGGYGYEDEWQGPGRGPPSFSHYPDGRRRHRQVEETEIEAKEVKKEDTECLTQDLETLMKRLARLEVAQRGAGVKDKKDEGFRQEVPSPSSYAEAVQNSMEQTESRKH